jgi:4-diphosphocytidyl-2-C-methyl-D-erythritol kinase
MLAFPNAKINLGLRILNKRPDGYHDIDSCLYPIPWHDILEIMESEKFEFHQSGINIEGNEEDNLCVKAYQILRKDFDLPNVQIHLHKNIPTGAGLGGGSSDASFTLKLLNAIFNLNLKISSLKNYAAKLGSDCPFFIENIPMKATGTGTELSALRVDLSDYWIGVIKPDIHVSTKEAYQNVELTKGDPSLEQLLNKPISSWKSSLVSDWTGVDEARFGSVGMREPVTVTVSCTATSSSVSCAVADMGKATHNTAILTPPRR